MSVRRGIVATLGLVAVLALPAAAPAATPSVAWSIQSAASPTNFAPGDESGRDRYLVSITNSGGKATEGTIPIKIVDRLPAGLVVQKVELTVPRGSGLDIAPGNCQTKESGGVATVSCEVTEASASPLIKAAQVEPGQQLTLDIRVKTPPTVSGPLVNRVEVEGGGAQPAAWEATNQASASSPPTGFQEFRTELLGADGLPAREADSHPYAFVTSFAVNTVPTEPGAPAPFVPVGGDLKGIEVALPPGLAANPMAVDRCTAEQFINVRAAQSKFTLGNYFPNECPPNSAVGLVAVQQLEGSRSGALAPLYNLTPPKGMPAQLGFEIAGQPVYINTKLRSDGDYGVTAYVANGTQARRVTAARITTWGWPGDPSHDTMRGQCSELEEICSGGTPDAFMRLPSSCENPLGTTFLFSTWAVPPASGGASSTEAPPVGCAAPPFEPEIEALPSTNAADSPAGIEVSLELPQEEGEAPGSLGHADLREAKVTLPRGLVVNPASADGLGSCTPAQVGLTTAPGELPARFNLAPAQCPDSAKVGTVEIEAPALDHPLEGAAYVASQEDNPFNSLIALYVVLEDEQTGVVIKQALKVSPDPVTGQLTNIAQDVPQVPFDEFRFQFFEGARAPLRTPMRCGERSTTTEMTPWTAPEGEKAFPASSFEITRGPSGDCPNGSLDPKLNAGFASPEAGTYSPFSLRLTRADGTGEFAGLTTFLPAGFTARLAGIPYCSEAAIAQAKGREHPGGGAEELASPSCPGNTQVGTVSAGAGAGPSPFYVGGSLYLAGPYKGAPLSLVAIIPAKAGPFDLGTVVNRVASYVDRETAQVKAVADPLPTIIAGIPVDTRDLRVNIDRPNFALSPTSCEPKEVKATVTGTSGQSADVSERFQVGNCKSLKFKPKITLRLKGGTKRSKNPALKAVVTYPQKGRYANTAKASVALPRSEFLEQAHIRTICTRVQFAANACPKGAVYGKAKAFSPLLDKPLAGKVYLRSSSNPLPDMVLDLHGQLDVAAVARVDSHKGGIRVSFEAVPDAPLSKAIVEMQGGKKGLLVNSRNICNHVNKATAKFTAHNGKAFESRPVLKDDCKKGKGGKKKQKGKGKKKG